jgi:hypothetical protein
VSAGYVDNGRSNDPIQQPIPKRFSQMIEDVSQNVAICIKIKNYEYAPGESST